MGILYNSVKAHQEMKRNFLINRLKEKGVIKDQLGTVIEELSYDDLKYLLVLEAFREIDVENSENKWF
jgi:hypothetical protein